MTKSMEEEILKSEKKEAKSFSKKTAAILVISTVILTGLMVCFLSEWFITSSTDNKLIAQISYDKRKVEKKPNDPALRVQLGYSYLSNGNISDATEQFNKALNLDKNYYPAYLNLAILYDNQGQNSKALVNAIRASELAPKDYKALLIEGISYRKLKRFDKASSALEKALSLNSTNVDIIYEIGYLAEVKKDYKAAKEIYKDALTYNPIYKPALNGKKRVEGKSKK